jgi:uncharacterized protein (DUF4213/DUF364 family)
MQSCPHSPHALNQPGQPGPAQGQEKAILTALLDNLDQPGAKIEKVVVGPSLTAVLAGERLGLASHLGARPSTDQAGLAEELEGATCARAAKLVLKSSAYEVSLGMACLNAGLLPKATAETRPIQEVVAGLAQDGEAALVGQFPFTGWLRENVAKLHLFELQAVEGRLPREQWDQVLSRVKVAAITSTVFLTRHASYYLSMAKGAVRFLIGPSTPLSPCLFDHGAHVLAGSLVNDPERVMASAQKGGCFSAVVKGGGIEFVVMKAPEVSLRLGL